MERNGAEGSGGALRCAGLDRDLVAELLANLVCPYESQTAIQIQIKLACEDHTEQSCNK